MKQKKSADAETPSTQTQMTPAHPTTAVKWPGNACLDKAPSAPAHPWRARHHDSNPD